MCEALVIVFGYVDDDMVIQQKVSRLMLLAKSLSGDELPSSMNSQSSLLNVYASVQL